MDPFVTELSDEPAAAPGAAIGPGSEVGEAIAAGKTREEALEIRLPQYQSYARENLRAQAISAIYAEMKK